VERRLYYPQVNMGHPQPPSAYVIILTCLLCFSVFLGNIKEAFDKDAHLKNLLLDDFFKNAIEKCQV
jgi:6-phosphogluconate dehydrogenase